LDDAFLADWCLRYLGAPFERVLFRSGFLSEVVGVELSSGLRAVVKARPFQPRIGGCLQVQAALARVGFPCPEPLTVATRVHGMTVTDETEVPGGSPLPTEAGAAPFAALLARLIGSAPAPAAVLDLVPSPPWTGWDHPGRGLWPDFDEHGQDLNLVGGPEWVDDAARRVRERLTSTPGRVCIGHGDWESQNIRWTGRDSLVVHDWDPCHRPARDGHRGPGRGNVAPRGGARCCNRLGCPDSRLHHQLPAPGWPRVGPVGDSRCLGSGSVGSTHIRQAGGGRGR